MISDVFECNCALNFVIILKIFCLGLPFLPLLSKVFDNSAGSGFEYFRTADSLSPFNFLFQRLSGATQPLTSILPVTAAEIKTVRSLTSIEINYG